MKELNFNHHRWEPVNVFIYVRKVRKNVPHNTENQPDFVVLDEKRNKFCENNLSQKFRISKLLQEARMRSGLTQKQLARISNLHWTLVRDAELGKDTVDPTHIEILCHTLNMTI